MDNVHRLRFDSDFHRVKSKPRLEKEVIAGEDHRPYGADEVLFCVRNAQIKRRQTNKEKGPTYEVTPAGWTG